MCAASGTEMPGPVRGGGSFCAAARHLAFL